MIVLEQTIWNADNETTLIERKHDQIKEKMESDEKDKFARQDAELVKQSFNANTLKYEAFENVGRALSSCKIKSTSSKVEEDDIVANLAKSWFQEKAAGK